MLQELDQNTTMTEEGKDKFMIHHANVFHPKSLAIRCMTGRNGDLMAVSKDYREMGETNQPLSILEVYRIYPKFAPKLIQTFINYETVTGIAWASPKLLLTVTTEQTINLWSLRKGNKCKSIQTDYGPISCMKYSEKHGLLVTGTEYGYSAVYKVCLKENTIELQSKMVKIPNKIQTIDIGFRLNESVTVKLLKPASDEPKVQSRKRKRKHTVEESDDEVDPKEEKFLSSTEVTIYGATSNEVVVWDYHKKSILDTIHVGDDSCQVLSLSALMNGDILVGDSKGCLSLFSHTTFTCRQTLKVLESSVLCIATNDLEDTILVSGKEPAIVTLRRQEAIGEEILLFERIETHIYHVTCIVFSTRTEFFTGGLDGFMIKYKLVENNGTLTLKKNITLPDYQNHIKFSRKEMMIQYDRSLVIWKLPDYESIEIPLAQDKDMPKPVKIKPLKAGTHIHSSAFSDKWISYSTEENVHIFDRKLQPYYLDKELPDCNLLVLCSNSRYLAACSGHDLYIIDLGGDQSTTNSPVEGRTTEFKVVKHTLKSIARHAINLESQNMLIIGCGPSKSTIYTFTFNSTSETILEKIANFSISHHEISFMTYNSAVEDDSSIYIYTAKDQIVKLDTNKSAVADVFTKFDKCESVQGLPDDANILGMIFVSKDHCILYDNHRMFKIDLVTNKVVNQRTDYDYIIKMNNSVFDKVDQIALVELTPDDYKKALPNLKQLKKFG